MSSNYPLVHKPLPDEREVNQDVLQRHLAGTAAKQDDGRIADYDATFLSLMHWIINSKLPPTHTLDCAVRIALPQHSSLPSLMVRHFVEFTLVYGVCLAANALHPGIAFKVECWCVVCNLIMASLLGMANDDTSLFFHRLAEAFVVVAIVGMLLVVSPANVHEAGIALLIGIAVSFVLAFPSEINAGDMRSRSVRLIWIMVLVHALPRANAFVLQIPSSLAAGLFFAVNYLALLPIPIAMQHWFAANPFASLEDVRSFGPSAPLYRGNRREAAAGVHTYLISAVTAIVCTAGFAWNGAALHAKAGALQPDYESLIRWVVVIELAAVMNYLAFELIVQRRSPSLSRYFSSYYSTWRALAAWLSRDPTFIYPTIFQFVRPWSHHALRCGIVVVALSLNSVFCLNWLANWSMQAYHASAVALEREQASDPPRATQQFDAPKFGTHFWTANLIAAVVMPVLMATLLLHATWGPSFQAYTERFELFKQRSIPPLLSFSLRRSLGRPLSLLLSTTALIGGAVNAF